MVGYENLVKREFAPFQLGEDLREPLGVFVEKRQRRPIKRDVGKRHRTTRYRHELLLDNWLIVVRTENDAPAVRC
jgi:hypothetical protein